MKRWIRRQAQEIKAEQQELAVDKDTLRDLIHDVADAVGPLLAATEQLEQVLIELAARQEEE